MRKPKTAVDLARQVVRIIRKGGVLRIPKDTGIKVIAALSEAINDECIDHGTRGDIQYINNYLRGLVAYVGYDTLPTDL